MNAAGSAIFWCAVQVALVGTATIGAYWLVVKLHQAAGGFVATTGLAVVFCLSAAAASPWPRWSFLDERPAENDDESPPRWTKLPFVGALAKSIWGRSDDPGSAPLLPQAPAPVVVTGATATAAAAAEERPQARSLLHGAPGAFWLGQPPRAGGWRWSGSLAVMFAVGLAIGGVRLLCALLAAAALRRRSRPVRDDRMRELLESLKTELGASQSIELRQSSGLSAAATIGWRRPVILLPRHWRSWTERERRTVLAHEIAHVQRGDYLLWLAAQMAMTLHFYHPAVHWLAARIRLEQEFAADAAAAAVSGGRRAYLATLARLTLRTASPATVPLSFVSNRDMLLQRIERLRSLETDAPALNRWGSKFVAVAILLLAGVVASGLRGSAEDSAAPAHRNRQNARELETVTKGASRAQNDAAAWPGGRAPG